MKSKNPALYEKISKINAYDCHTHIDVAHPIARGIHDVFLYHMVISDLYSAGCPHGMRLSEEPSSSEIESRVVAAIPYLSKIQNTSCFFLMDTILKELFDWHEPITPKNWVDLDARIKDYGAKENRLREIMRKAHIVKSNTELWRGRDGSLDDIFTYSLEWSFFTRAQWGRYDTALIELEYAWNHDEPCPPLPVTITPELVDFAKKIKTMDDVEAAVNHYIKKTPHDKIVAIASHLSTDICYRTVSRDDMISALSKRENAGALERDIYANYIFNRYLDLYEAGGYKTVLQFSTAAEPLPFESGSKMRSDTIFELAHIFEAHPSIHFNLHISNMAQNQSFCTLVRELPNVSLNGYWWHNFYPSFISRVLSERLDMLPINKIVGFFSDAYCMEWAYAKQRYIRTFTTNVLSERMAFGQYSEQTAIEIAGELFGGTASNLFGVKL